jgi:glycosyltransferase involved in cell wall biosynthesis
MTGFNVIGHVTANLGLGVLARNVVRLLAHRGVPVAALDIDAGHGRSGMDLSLKEFLVPRGADLPHPINLFVLPAPTLRYVLPKVEAVALAEGRIDVAFPMWELATIPQHWHSILEFFDAIIAGSPFIRAAHESALSNVFTIPAEVPLFLPDRIMPARHRFGPRAASRVVFLTAFEPHSDVIRKNPLGTIRAFRQAATGRDDLHLVVKVNNPASDWRSDPSMRTLVEASAGCEAITFLTEPFGYQEALGLYAAADVIVSLHRAEGVGFLPMEAMLLGKPVIATGWSGNMAYMNHRVACLVDYELVPLHAPGGIYEKLLAGEPATWAEPNLATAAAWMRRLASDPALRIHYGELARAHVAAFQESALRASFVDEVVELFSNRTLLCKSLAVKHGRLRNVSEIDLIPAPAARSLAAQIASLKQAIADRDTELEAIRNSTSWRLSAPLRRLATILRH